jgi:succinate-acetate transporter protein
MFGRRSRGASLLTLVYVIVGVAIAANHHYFDHIHGWRGVLSALLAVFLWPLILLGIDLHVRP